MRKSLISILITVSLIFGIMPKSFGADSSAVIKDYTFGGTSGNIMYGNISGEVSYISPEEGIKAVHWASSSDKSTDAIADISLPEMEEKKNYVFDMRLKINKLTGSSVIGFLDSKESDGSWTVNGFDLSSDGKLTKSGSSSATIPFGEWVRLSFIYNLSEGRIYVYVNGTQKISNWNWSTRGAKPVYWRFDIDSPQNSELDIYIDWLRIYDGSALLDDSYFEQDNTYSVMDDPKKLDNAISGKIVFLLTNNAVYHNGKKEIIQNENEKIKTVNNIWMVPENTLKKINDGKNLSYDANTSTVTLGDKTAVISPVFQDGIMYLPLTEVVEKLMSKKVIYDVRDMAIIGDSVADVREDVEMYLDKQKKFYDYDLIYRYLLFDNPTGEKIVSDLIQRYPANSHPRIYWTNDDKDYVLSKINSDTRWKSEYNQNINVAENVLTADMSGEYNASDSEKQNAASSFQTNITSLASAYILTGNEKYAKKGIEIMKGFASWDNLDYNTSTLAIGYWSQGMGIGFDAFYNYMNSTSEGKEDIAYFKERIKELVFKQHTEAYKNGPAFGPAWITLQDNFVGCIGGGMMCLLLAVCDEDDLKEDSEFLLENVLRSLYIAAEVFFPDGGYYEGVTYADMMLENFTNALDALFNCCNTDYGIGNVPGFSKAGEYFVYMNTPDGRLNFHDDGGRYYNRFVPEYMAYRYGENETGILGRISKDIAGLGSVPNYGLKGLYYYDKAITDKNITFDVSEADLDKYFDNIGTGTFRNSHTDEAPTYAGFHGGYTNISHDMLDLGEFSFISDGVVWASDLGSDSYSLPGYFQESGYKIYRKRPEGENCLVINPGVDADSYYGQKIGAKAELAKIDINKPKGAMSVLDLTDAYERDVSKYQRGYYFGDDRRTFKIQDEVNLKGNSEVYWFMHTLAEITINSNNSATLRKDGKTLNVEVYCNQEGFELKSMSASPLPTSPSVSGQASNQGYSKLAIYHPNANGNLVISVKLSPESEYENSPLEYIPISEWTVPDGEIESEPMFKGIYADGKLISGFSSKKDSYRIILPYGTTKIPVISADSNKGNINITQADSLSGKAKLTIKCDGYDDVNCTIEFIVSNDRPINVKSKESDTSPLGGVIKDIVPATDVSVMNVSPSDSDISNITDNNTDTYYTLNETNAWIELDFGKVMEIEGVAISLKSGSGYKILYSEDGTNYEQIYAGSSLKTSGYEILPVWGRVRYVRFVSLDETADVAEFSAYYPAGGLVSQQSGKIIGKGIPTPENLTLTDGDYTIAVEPSGCGVTSENGSLKIIDSSSRHIIKSQIKYNADVNSAKLRYDYNLSFVGYPYVVTLKVYSKNMTLYNTFDLVYGDGKNWRATGYPAISNGRNFDISFTVDLLTGEYAGTVNGIALDNIKSGKFSDLSDGIGMVELCVNTRDANSGMILNDASLTELLKYDSVSKKTVCDGIPQTGSLTYKNGKYTMNINPSSCNVTYENGMVKVIDSGSRHIIQSQIIHPFDAGSSKLKYDFNFSFVGYPYIATLNVYSKNMTLYKSFDLVYGDGKNWRATDYPAINNNTTFNLTFTIDLLSGIYSGTVNGKVLDRVGNGTGSISDLSDGIGMVELCVDTRSANSGIILKGASLTELLKYRADKINIGEVLISEDGLSAEATISVFGEEEGDEILFILASYSDGGKELMVANEKKYTLKQGTNNLSVHLDNLDGGNVVKAFLWSADEFTPLCIPVKR